MTGVYTPTEGKIRFKGKEIAGTKPHKINHLGIAIILIMILRPQGIIPSRRRAMELKDRAKEAAPQ